MSRDAIGAYDPKNTMTIGALLRYVQHKYDCDWLQVNWHKGPCDCGLKELIQQLPEDLLKLLVETNDHVHATVEDMKVQAEREREEQRERDRKELSKYNSKDPCGHNDDGTDYG